MRSDSPFGQPRVSGTYRIDADIRELASMRARSLDVPISSVIELLLAQFITDDYMKTSDGFMNRTRINGTQSYAYYGVTSGAYARQAFDRALPNSAPDTYLDWREWPTSVDE